MARHKGIWHERPVFAPVVWWLSTTFTGTLSYYCGWILTRDIRSSLCLLLFMDALVVLYLTESYRSSRSEVRDANSPRENAQ